MRAAGAAAFDEVRYAMVWEDPRVLRRALAVGPGDVVLSIAAAGDNALALLLDDPARIDAVDFSPAQLAQTELKIAACRALDRAACLAFLGVTPSSTRPAVYAALHGDLSPRAAAFFDARPDDVAGGVLFAGRFERYLARFRRLVLPLVHSRATIAALLAVDGAAAQRSFFASRWDNARWRALFRLFFGRVLLGRLGRDPTFFAHVVERDVGAALLARADRAVRELPMRDNYFVEWILTGRLGGGHGLPPWLEAGAYEVVRARLDRVRLVEADLVAFAAAAPATYDAFNLSDCFEWMGDEQAERALAAIAAAGRPGARLCYWNLLVPRRRPAALADRVEEDRAAAASLHAVDRCFFYADVVVERIIG